MANEHVAVFVTAPSAYEAGQIADFVLRKKLAACASVIKGVDSSYWWQGRIEKASEALIIMKTQKKLFGKLCAAVKKTHSYEVPEIVALPLSAGNLDYLKWINASVK